CELQGGIRCAWTLEEILAAIPDLKRDFEICYQGVEPYTIPVQIIRKPRMNVERIAQEEIAKHTNLQNMFDRIMGLKTAYLPVQHGNLGHHVSLHPRKSAED